MASVTITSMSDKQKQDVESTVRKEQGRLFAFIRNRVSDRQDAEDILQDVFVQFVTYIIYIIRGFYEVFFKTNRKLFR